MSETAGTEQDEAGPPAGDAAEGSAVTLGPPRMSQPELALFRDVLGRGFRRYGEFGLGGSTLEAVRGDFTALVAVDSDERWVQAVRQHPEMLAARRSRRLSVLHARIGPVGAWGKPADPATVRTWPRYVGTAWAEWSRRGEQPDLVFVDGRFRVACALSALLACPAAPPTLMVHDMTEGRIRSGYAPMLRFCEIVEQAESLCLLRPHAGLDSMALMTAFTDSMLVTG